MKKQNNIILIISTALIVIGLFVSTFLSDFIPQIQAVITMSTAIIGAVAIWIQFKKNQEVNEAAFLIDFNSTFYSMGSLAAEFETILDNDYSNIIKHKVTVDDSEKAIKYLVWLKTLSELILRGSLSIKGVDRLFSYKFFIAANNKEIQEIFLVPNADTYKAIFIVHNMWLKYRKKHDLPIIKEETDLSKVKNYPEYAGLTK